MEVWLAKMPIVFPFSKGRYTDNRSAPGTIGLVVAEVVFKGVFCAVQDILSIEIRKAKTIFIVQISGKIGKQNVKD
jgi:hypothetical protein